MVNIKELFSGVPEETRCLSPDYFVTVIYSIADSIEKLWIIVVLSCFRPLLQFFKMPCVKNVSAGEIDKCLKSANCVN